MNIGRPIRILEIVPESLPVPGPLDAEAEQVDPAPTVAVPIGSASPRP